MACEIGLTYITTLKSLKNCTLVDSFCPKHLMFQLSNFRGIMSHDTGDAKFKGILTCDLKNDISSLANFYASSRLVLCKAYKGLDETVQKSFVS